MKYIFIDPYEDGVELLTEEQARARYESEKEMYANDYEVYSWEDFVKEIVDGDYMGGSWFSAPDDIRNEREADIWVSLVCSGAYLYDVTRRLSDYCPRDTSLVLTDWERQLTALEKKQEDIADGIARVKKNLADYKAEKAKSENHFIQISFDIKYEESQELSREDIKRKLIDMLSYSIDNTLTTAKGLVQSPFKAERISPCCYESLDLAYKDDPTYDTPIED